jgi:hypothetical protein
VNQHWLLRSSFYLLPHSISSRPSFGRRFTARFHAKLPETDRGGFYQHWGNGASGMRHLACPAVHLKIRMGRGGLFRSSEGRFRQSDDCPSPSRCAGCLQKDVTFTLRLPPRKLRERTITESMVQRRIYTKHEFSIDRPLASGTGLCLPLTPFDPQSLRVLFPTPSVVEVIGYFMSTPRLLPL